MTEGTLGGGGASVTSVGTSAVTIMYPAPRTLLYFKNVSTGGQVISLSLSRQVAVAASGITLNPGDAYTESDSENFKCWEGIVSAVASAAGGALSCLEDYRPVSARERLGVYQ